MDLEKLTRHQIVLLALLVSFVSSIATGIVTVSLMSQAPPGVSRTINQIVERTVQTVAPAAVDAAPGPIEKTIVVKEDDLVTQSIATVQKSIIRITVKGGDDLIARGVVIEANGMAITDRTALNASGASAFDAILPDGTQVPVTLVSGNASSSIAVVQVALGTSTAVVPASLADSTKLALGQSIVRIGGSGVDTVGEGVIATLPTDIESGADNYVETNLDGSTPGSLIMTIFGQVIGISTGDSTQKGSDYYSLASIPSTPATVEAAGS